MGGAVLGTSLSPSLPGAAALVTPPPTTGKVPEYDGATLGAPESARSRHKTPAAGTRAACGACPSATGERRPTSTRTERRPGT